MKQEDKLKKQMKRKISFFKSKSLLLTFFGIFLLLQPAISQKTEIKKVEPLFWWTGMQNPNLQLLVYGNQIGNTEVSLQYPGVELREVIKVPNPDYLFINLRLSKDVQPGKFEIHFTSGKKQQLTYAYELRKRKPGSAERTGFNSSDAMYLIMPDRFANGNPDNDNMPGMLEKADRSNLNGRHGGDIQGIEDHLDYISGMGFTALWINPLLENNMPAYSYHGYAITDYYKIDPRFGTNEDYVRLVNECHTKGIKVVMDMVFNHCGLNHWWMSDLPEKDWINQWPEFTRTNYRATAFMDPHASEFDKKKMEKGWFDNSMPDLNQQNQLLGNYLRQNSIWWIEYAGLDGIRMDTWPYPNQQYMADWTQQVLSEYPDFSIVGEVWMRKEALVAYWAGGAKNPDGYDSHLPSVTDFPFCFSLADAFKEPEGWTEGLGRIYYTLTQDYLYANPQMNLIFADNHDMSRYYETVGKDIRRFKMGMAVLLTSRGIPEIYYGTELLMSGDANKGHGYIRQDFPGGWPGDSVSAFEPAGRTPQQNDAFNYMVNLLLWRKNKEVIHSGKTMQFAPDNDVYVYFRYNDKDVVMVLLNNNDTQDKTVGTSRFAEIMSPFKQAHDVISGKLLNSLENITIPAKSAMVLELK